MDLSSQLQDERHIILYICLSADPYFLQRHGYHGNRLLLTPLIIGYTEEDANLHKLSS